MTSILALDTATPACSAALFRDGKVLSRYELLPQSHTRLLLPMVDALLVESAVSLQQLDAITFTHGPGSFTGIRIGFSVVQGLAMGAGLPVIPVSTLRLLAETARTELSLTLGQHLFAALDARMGDLYWAHFRVADDQVEEIAGDQLSPLVSVLEDMAPENFAGAVGVGDGWLQLQDQESKPDSLYTEIYPKAESLLPIALSEIQAGNVRDVREIQPLYLREKVSWKKREWLRPRA